MLFSVFQKSKISPILAKGKRKRDDISFGRGWVKNVEWSVMADTVSETSDKQAVHSIYMFK